MLVKEISFVLVMKDVVLVVMMVCALTMILVMLENHFEHDHEETSRHVLVDVQVTANCQMLNFQRVNDSDDLAALLVVVSVKMVNESLMKPMNFFFQLMPAPCEEMETS